MGYFMFSPAVVCGDVMLRSRRWVFLDLGSRKWAYVKNSRFTRLGSRYGQFGRRHRREVRLHRDLY